LRRRPIVHTFEYEPGQTFNLRPFGDQHLGGRDCDVAAIKRDVASVAEDPDTYWLQMGDAGEFIDVKDRRFSPGMYTQRYMDAMHRDGDVHMEMVKHYGELYASIKDKCLAVLKGNHEERVWQRLNIDLGTAIALTLERPDLLLGYSGWVVLKFKRKSSGAAGSTFNVNLQLHHGWSAARSPGSFYNQARLEKAANPAADIILRGHAHSREARVWDSTTLGRTYVGNRKWCAVLTGTYKNGTIFTEDGEAPHTTYSEEKGYAPVMTMGSPVIEIVPDASMEAGFDLKVTL